MTNLWMDTIVVGVTTIPYLRFEDTINIISEESNSNVSQLVTFHDAHAWTS